MSTQAEVYLLIALIHTIGYLQTAFTELFIFTKYPSIASFKLETGIMVSRKFKWLKAGYSTPGIWLLTFAKLGLGMLMFIFLYRKEIPFYWPLLMVLVDQLGFLKFRTFGRSETPLQRVVLVTLAMHLLLKDDMVSFIGLAFISLQLSLAYFAAGYHKTKDPKWKKGWALEKYINRYLHGTSIKTFIVKYKKSLSLLGWATIAFELLFVTGAFNTHLAIALCGFGILFHAAVSLSSGINEFFWVFVGCYPAFIFVSQTVSHFIFI